MLTKQQQDIIENSIWVVNTALKKQGLQADEDLRQSAILYMCKCLERFDPTKNIKWTTFAYKNIYLFIKRTHAKQLKKDSYIVDGDVLYLMNQISDNNFNKRSDFKHQIDLIKANCTIDECNLIDLKLKGYKITEIAQIMKCSTSKTINCMHTIKEKTMEMER